MHILLKLVHATGSKRNYTIGKAKDGHNNYFPRQLFYIDSPRSRTQGNDSHTGKKLYRKKKTGVRRSQSTEKRREDFKYRREMVGNVITCCLTVRRPNPEPQYPGLL